MLRLCGYCGGVVDTIISAFTQLHTSSFNLEFEISFDSIWHVVSDLRQRKCEINFKKAGFERKGSGVVSKFSLGF